MFKNISDLWGFNPSEYNEGSLLTEIKKKREELVDLTLKLKNMNKTARYKFNADMLKSVTRDYPYFKSQGLSPIEGGFIIDYVGFPLEFVRMSSGVTDTFYTTLPMYSMTATVDYFGRRYSFRNKSRKNFFNGLRTVTGSSLPPGVNEQFKLMLEKAGVTAEVLFPVDSLDIEADPTYGVAFTHPHVNNARPGQECTQCCYGTNPFNEIISNKKLTDAQDFLSLIKYMLLWMQTGNMDDWYGSYMGNAYTAHYTRKLPEKGVRCILDAFVLLDKMLQKMGDVPDDDDCGLHGDTLSSLKNDCANLFGELSEYLFDGPEDNQRVRTEVYVALSTLAALTWWSYVPISLLRESQHRLYTCVLYNHSQMSTSRFSYGSYRNALMDSLLGYASHGHKFDHWAYRRFTDHLRNQPKVFKDLLVHEGASCADVNDYIIGALSYIK